MCLSPLLARASVGFCCRVPEAAAVPVSLSEPGDESLGFEWIDSVAAKAIPTD